MMAFLAQHCCCFDEYVALHDFLLDEDAQKLEGEGYFGDVVKRILEE